MFLSRNKKNNVYPCKPQFYYIKVWFKGVKIIVAFFVMIIWCAFFFKEGIYLHHGAPTEWEAVLECQQQASKWTPQQ